MEATKEGGGDRVQPVETNPTFDLARSPARRNSATHCVTLMAQCSEAGGHRVRCCEAVLTDKLKANGKRSTGGETQ
jgi:hypothetical protein